MQTNTIYEGDCLEIMREMLDNIVDTIITDPPYGLSFMGKDWDHGLPGVAYWCEALRVAKPGATLMAFGGTRTYHRLACAIEDAGWEIRDCISYFSDGTQQERAFMASLDEEQLVAYLELHYPTSQMAWVYGQGMGLGLNVSKAIDKAMGEEREVVGIRHDADKLNKPGNHQYHEGYQRPWREDPQKWEEKRYITAPSTPLAKTFDGWNSRLKPAFEPIVVAMKPLDGTYAENAEKWGIAGYWLDGGRVGTEETIRTIQGQSEKQQNGLMYSGRDQRNKRVFENNKGRFPSNLIHSNEPGVLREFGKAGVSAGGKRRNTVTRKTSSNSLNKGAGKIGYENNRNEHNDSGSAARYFATCPPDEPARFTYHAKASSKERGNGNHPTVKPLSLIRYLCKLTRTPIGGLVLDPFAGSGTTALACISEKRDYILIEKEPDYANLCKRRIAEYNGEEIAPIEIKVTENITEKQMALW